MSARVTVRCPACGWAGQREHSIRDRPCHDCGGVVEVRRGREGVGRPTLPVYERWVELRAWVLPATLAALGPEPAATLDALAADALILTGRRGGKQRLAALKHAWGERAIRPLEGSIEITAEGTPAEPQDPDDR